jgi:hypothetical protein
MQMKPWYNVVTPREDLRQARPMDASEFAVHLDHVRDGRAPEDYQKPERFLERTYLTKNLVGLAGEVMRRLSGEKTETSAVFNMTTQFGGGKTHALTLLYHLAKNGPAADDWTGVRKILKRAGVNTNPKAATAVFVGTEFDSLTGRGGKDGTPLRKTPWGEIAYQLGGAEALALLGDHEAQFIEPKGDVIRAFLPKDRPVLILLDEIINYVSTYRRLGYHNSLYNFLQSLAETARGQDNVVLVVSVPASELEYTVEDQADQQRFQKMLDRVGKAVIIAAEGETSEIIRRRLFEWQGVPEDGKKTVEAYAAWVSEYRHQLPSWFPADNAAQAFRDAYPFHPMVLSVFERKWQALPRFQQTRGVLRLLALWVSRAYQDGFRGANKDALLDLGTAPLDDPMFRAAMFEQLGETRLEVAVTTDICGKPDAHAVRLDSEATDPIRKGRLHRKVASAIFFESNGGQMQQYATLPEARLAVGAPDLDIANVETVLEDLAPPDGACYFLNTSTNRYWFSFKPNLTKLLSDRRVSVQAPKIEELVRAEIQKVFGKGAGVERVFFPEKSSDVPDRPALTLVIPAPAHAASDPVTMRWVENLTKESGMSARTFKSALIWCLAEGESALCEEARKVLAWQDILDEAHELRLDEAQEKQANESLKKSQSALRESVWRSYKYLLLLGKDNQMRTVDLGLVHSSAADSMVTFILAVLKLAGDLEDNISPNFLDRNWPPAFIEWSTKSVRDAFFASPLFPRLRNAEAVKETIAKGVTNGVLGYVGKTAGGDYVPFLFETPLNASDVEIADQVLIVTRERALAYQQAMAVPPPLSTVPPPDNSVQQPPATGLGQFPVVIITPPVTPPTPVAYTQLSWTGEVPSQKWMNFYTKVLARFASGKGLRLSITVEAAPEGGVSTQKVEETEVALRELGLPDHVHAE